MTKPTLLFKVLDQNMQSCNGGTLQWKLNQWQHVDGILEMCKRGLHLTKDPLAWMTSDTRLFVAEAQDIHEWREDKCVCQSVRLLAEVPQPLWDEYVKKTQTLWDEYEKKKQTLRDEYVKKTQTLWDELIQKTLAETAK